MRDQARLGRWVGEGQGEVGTPMGFAGGQANPGGLAAADYNNLWETAWELDARPDNFDQLVAERYGSPLTPQGIRNPYPVLKADGTLEDPNAPGVDGGSGQLPLAFTQLRKPDGTWTGEIGVKICVMCHNGQLGTEADGPGMGPQLAKEPVKDVLRGLLHQHRGRVTLQAGERRNQLPAAEMGRDQNHTPASGAGG